MMLLYYTQSHQSVLHTFHRTCIS